MKTRRLISAVALLTVAIAFSLAGCGKSSQKAAKVPTEPVKIAISSWTGFAPLHIAAQKGFFEKQGVKVDLQVIQRVTDRRSALAANRIQGFASTVDTHVMTVAAGIPVVQVLALDDSYGGDGVVAKKAFKSLKDLKGKKVALETGGGASYFWFQYLLKQQGMKLSDVNVQNMSAGDAGAAFVAGKIDAAVTWEPWLSKAKATTFGQVLVSSTDTPGIIVDTLAFRKDFVTQYPDAVRGITQAWFDALDYAKTNPDDANAIMAKAMDQSVPDFVASLSTVKFYGRPENADYFGTADKPGKLYQISEECANLWLEEKLIDQKPVIADLINGSFIK